MGFCKENGRSFGLPNMSGSQARRLAPRQAAVLRRPAKLCGVISPRATAAPTILFGAFDRHNFGDLLFAHVAAALLPGRELVFTGLAERDLRSHGGHRVSALAQVAADYGRAPVDILHVGGELLTCDAWQAAVMLLPPEEAPKTIACLDSRLQERAEWARGVLGVSALAPYTLSRALFPCAHRVIYCAVGGVDLDTSDAALRAEVLAKLRTANAVSVRDRYTLAHLAAAGIAARLLPDPAVLVAELFGASIRRHAQDGEVAQILAAFPQGYLAVQFSADFGDDATLAGIAAQLDALANESDCGVALFRAGAAPWHDDLVCYRRLAERLRAAPVRLFTSLNLWDICALIANSRAYLGSSLHGRIVAAAFARPCVNLRHPPDAGHLTKQAAWAATWEDPAWPGTIDPDGIARGVNEALLSDPRQRRRSAAALAVRYREGFSALSALLQ